MKSAEIILSDYGRNLGSRLFAKEVFSKIKDEVIIADEIYLNFKEVDRITLSFGTEIIDSISGLGVPIHAGNYNSSIEKMINFCLHNIDAKKSPA